MSKHWCSQILNALIFTLALSFVCFTSPSLAAPNSAKEVTFSPKVGSSKKLTQEIKLGPVNGGKSHSRSISLVSKAEVDMRARILNLESMGEWAEARKLMDSMGSGNVEARVAAKLMSEGKPEQAYEVLHDRVALFNGGGYKCGNATKNQYLTRETLKIIEKARALEPAKTSKPCE